MSSQLRASVLLITKQAHKYDVVQFLVDKAENQTFKTFSHITSGSTHRNGARMLPFDLA